ncbi:zinc-ribbon domain-containing protein [Bifidobacterium choloepi]|nr:zinc-ribbon domain-containing protein [Bifidobacterium choloepi]
MIGEFQNRSKPVSCRCLKCGVEADYVPYTVWGREDGRTGRPACDVCYYRWKFYEPRYHSFFLENHTDKQIAERCDKAKLDLIKVFRENGHDYAALVKCRRCQRRTVKDWGDIGFGCVCLSRTGSPKPPSRKKSSSRLPEDDADSMSKQSPLRQPLSECCPEIAAQWVYEMNGRFTPETVKGTSRRKIWWRCESCGKVWQENPYARLHNRPLWRCRDCEIPLGSLAYCAPDLAEEWAPENPVSAWHVTATGQTVFIPEWICRNDPSHRWHAKVETRYHGGSPCPDCKERGKSRVELEYCEAAKAMFNEVKSGPILTNQKFSRGTRWRPDILFLFEEAEVAVEYDGAYWHQDKRETDLRKSLDLLDAGYRVVRLREDSLPGLDITDAAYLELHIDSAHPMPESAMLAIKDWLLK